MDKKVLIVEDDKNLAETLKNTFSKKKMTVKISHSAQEAENLVSLEQYDLLLVDVVLPKVNGINFLKQIISKGLLHSGCKIWIMSGVFHQKIISKDMISHVDTFFKKPLNIKTIEKKLDALFVSADSLPKNLKFFYLETKEQNNVLDKKEYTIKGHELMFICFYLCSIRFNGVLRISYYGQEKPDEALFKEGDLISFKSIDSQSYLKPLLIKNNLISTEDLNQLLSEKSEVSLTDRLINGCYISPHKMDRLLKEQLAIKLFEIMEHPSVVVGSVDFISSVNFNQFARLQMRDLLSLVHNWIRSKVDVGWLKEFFDSCRQMNIKPLKRLSARQRFARQPGLEFLAADSMRENVMVGDMIEKSDKAEEETIRETYCRLVVKENCLEYKNNQGSHKTDYSFMKKKYGDFLKDSKRKNYFELLNLPLNASVNQIEDAYRNVVKIFHPDRRDSNMPSDMAEVCDQCFILVRNIYQTLIDPDKKKKYIKALEDKSRFESFEVKEAYIKGKRNVESGHYGKAIEQLDFALKHKTAPGDAVLYHIWSIIKSKDFILSEEDVSRLTNLFDNVGLEHRQSAVFFFSKGLFMKATGKRKTAFDLFTKSLRLDPQFTVARLEKYSLSVAKKKNVKKSLISLFKKSA